MKKKSFYFEDYPESALIDNNNNSNIVKISLNRVTFLSFIFFSLILIFIIKIIYLSLYSEIFFSNNIDNKNFIKERRDIVDRNGIILESNIEIYDAAVRQNLVKEKKKLLINLKLILPELDTNKIKENLNKNFFKLIVDMSLIRLYFFPVTIIHSINNFFGI